LPERSAPPDAFGRSAREYEQGRPEWPAELIDRVVERLGLGPRATVLDLGAGTGKLTRALVPRFAHVYAVEPDDAMRAVLEEVVAGAEARRGHADAVPLGDDAVDAVFSAEAFHWFATSETVAELERVLAPRGGVAIFWNIPQEDREPQLSEEAERVIDDAFRRGGAPGLPRVLSGEWRTCFEGSRFGELREERVDRWIVTDRAHWIANLLSVSSIAALAEDERAAFAARLRELCPDVDYRGLVRTVAYWTRLER
jgi:cyclopropane fatty-acyl-phospholipid synthase-like methyltransferase